MAAWDLALAASALSLAMDAFSVSICLGLCHERLRFREALILGGAFGFFQFFMPLLGGGIAGSISGFFDRWTPWIAALLIIWVAVSMIVEAVREEASSCMAITFSGVTTLSFATSLDALAVGFSMASTGGSALNLALLAGAITFTLSLAGALAGKKLGKRFGKKSEIFGGCVLLLIAGKIICSALSA
ncbi:MAG: manganese efflux pump [Synergistaceae bacterium]|nr:manganese efflux pump [Synergistaceae bacterium]